MITEESITKVKEEADILKVMDECGIKLTKRGSSLIACCPFHNETTPSFHVSTSKGIYKCFGCGVSGDAIQFVRENKNVDFIDAIRLVAEWHNVTLEEKDEAPEDKLIKEKRVELLEVNGAVSKLYYSHLQSLSDDHAAKLEVFGNRQLSSGIVIEFQIGFAPDEWKFISRDLIEKGKYQPALDLGLIATTNGSSFDVYKNRIIFPIHNERGQVIGFGGRTLDTKKESAKYINSKESLLYLKSKVLYGLYQAQTAIRKIGYAIVVEGYFDVISMHQSGAANTVCTGGTAFTDDHAKLIKRFTNHVVLMGDGDSAGKNSNLKAINILIKHGLRVDVCLLPEPENEGEKIDPDLFARQHRLSEEEVQES